MVTPLTYWRTIRHLRREQVFARLLHILPRSPLRPGPPPPLRISKQPFDKLIWRAGPIRRGDCFRFLNSSRRIATPADWDRKSIDRLWLYNLHYFEWLRESIAPERINDDAAWLDRWIRENPAGQGTGWEAYPLSRRIVNWIIWFITFRAGTNFHFDSLAMQLRHLERSIEYHLLGNHLIANAVALIFGGTFFDGTEADEWRRAGLDLLNSEIREQILADGGHFELSPMYHSLVLEDILDVIGLSQAYVDVLADAIAAMGLKDIAAQMRQWLRDICAPDGQIPYFNDAAFGIAPSPAELNSYGQDRGIPIDKADGPLRIKQQCGLAIVSRSPFHVIFDCGRVGPDYQPGHAHADTLSFELSLGIERLVTNSGTSTYAPGQTRNWERSTRAHATVEIDGLSSAETWASFRVGRRPNVGAVAGGDDGTASWAECWHDGYRHLSGSPIHRRRLTVTAEQVLVADYVHGTGDHVAKGIFPLHFDIGVEELSANSFRLRTRAGRVVWMTMHGPIEASVRTGRFAVGFNLTVERPVIEWNWHGQLPIEVTTRFVVEPSSLQMAP